MSCPYMPTAAVATEEETPAPDVTGEHARISRDFEQLLPACDKVRAALDACREGVRSRGSGHCLEPSRAWRACYERRSAQSRSIIRACGGPVGKHGQQRSHGQIQADYMKCVASQGVALTPAKQTECLEPLRLFLRCAQAVVTGVVTGES